jgi:hypothetical protein
MRGARGDALLMPAGEGLLAGRVLALGLGPLGGCDGAAGREAVADVLQRAAALRVRSLALPLPFSGAAGQELGDLDALLEAALAGWRSGSAEAADGLLVLVGQPGRGPALVRALGARGASGSEGLRILLPEEARRGSPRGAALSARL